MITKRNERRLDRRLRRYIRRTVQRPTQTILDELPLMDLHKGPWIAGGSALNYYITGDFKPTEVITDSKEIIEFSTLSNKFDDFHAKYSFRNDVDVYFKRKGQFHWFISHIGKIIDDEQHYKHEYHSNEIHYIEYSGHVLNAIGFEYHPDAKACIDSYDFTVCQVATDGFNFMLGEHTKEHIENRILSFVDPMAIDKELMSLTYNRRKAYWNKVDARIKKYQEKGFKPDADVLQLILKYHGD